LREKQLLDLSSKEMEIASTLEGLSMTLDEKVAQGGRE